MKLWKYAVRWYLGGMGYTALELLSIFDMSMLAV